LIRDGIDNPAVPIRDLPVPGYRDTYSNYWNAVFRKWLRADTGLGAHPVINKDDADFSVFSFRDGGNLIGRCFSAGSSSEQFATAAICGSISNLLAKYIFKETCYMGLDMAGELMELTDGLILMPDRHCECIIPLFLIPDAEDSATEFYRSVSGQILANKKNYSSEAIDRTIRQMGKPDFFDCVVRLESDERSGSRKRALYPMCYEVNPADSRTAVYILVRRDEEACNIYYYSASVTFNRMVEHFHYSLLGMIGKVLNEDGPGANRLERFSGQDLERLFDMLVTD
jgi:hypothetical protein